MSDHEQRRRDQRHVGDRATTRPVSEAEGGAILDRLRGVRARMAEEETDRLHREPPPRPAPAPRRPSRRARPREPESARPAEPAPTPEASEPLAEERATDERAEPVLWDTPFLRSLAEPPMSQAPEPEPEPETSSPPPPPPPRHAGPPPGPMSRLPETWSDEPYTPYLEPIPFQQALQEMREEQARARQRELEETRRRLDALLERGTPIAPGMRVLPPGAPSLTEEALRLGLPERGVVETPEGPVLLDTVTQGPRTFEEMLEDLSELPEDYRRLREEVQSHDLGGLLGIVEGATSGAYERTLALPIAAIEYIDEHGLGETLSRLLSGLGDLLSNPDQLLVGIGMLGYEMVIGPIERIGEELEAAWRAFAEGRNVDGGRHIARAWWELFDLLTLLRGVYRTAMRIPALAESVLAMRRMTRGMWAAVLERLAQTRRRAREWAQRMRDRAAGLPEAVQDRLRAFEDDFIRGLQGMEPSPALAGGSGRGPPSPLMMMEGAEDTARGTGAAARGAGPGARRSSPRPVAPAAETRPGAPGESLPAEGAGAATPSPVGDLLTTSAARLRHLAQRMEERAADLYEARADVPEDLSRGAASRRRRLAAGRDTLRRLADRLPELGLNEDEIRALSRLTGDDWMEIANTAWRHRGSSAASGANHVQGRIGEALMRREMGVRQAARARAEARAAARGGGGVRYVDRLYTHHPGEERALRELADGAYVTVQSTPGGDRLVIHGIGEARSGSTYLDLFGYSGQLARDARRLRTEPIVLFEGRRRRIFEPHQVDFLVDEVDWYVAGPQGTSPRSQDLELLRQQGFDSVQHIELPMRRESMRALAGVMLEEAPDIRRSRRPSPPPPPDPGSGGRR